MDPRSTWGWAEEMTSPGAGRRQPWCLLPGSWIPDAGGRVCRGSAWGCWSFREVSRFFLLQIRNSEIYPHHLKSFLGSILTKLRRGHLLSGHFEPVLPVCKGHLRWAAQGTVLYLFQLFFPIPETVYRGRGVCSLQMIPCTTAAIMWTVWY